MNEWTLRKATKVHVYAQSFFFQAWENLLKFDTAAWNRYHWSIYSASGEFESSSTVIAQGQTFSINKLELAMKVLTFAKDENMQFI